jgi:hypothetical protein
MKRPLLESEKNFLKCAVLMLICAIAFFCMGKSEFGIGCGVLAVIFAAVGISMYIKDDSGKGSR